MHDHEHDHEHGHEHRHDHPPLIALEGVEVEETKPWQRVVSVKVPVDAWLEAREKAARKLRRDVTLPGFRKGKAPMAKVEAQFGANIDMDALEWVLPRAWHQATHELDFLPINEPEYSAIDFGEGKPFSFKATVELRPELRIEGVEGMKVTWYKEEVPPQALDQTLESLREGRAEFDEVERPAVDGDRVTADFHQVDAGGLPIVGTQVSDHSFELGSPMILADFSDGLRDMSPGDERTFSVSYPGDYDRKELAGTTRGFRATLKKVEAKRLPEMDDDFARELGDFENMESLRKRLRGNIELEIEGRNRERLDAALIHSAMAKNEFEVPPSMVTRYVDAMVEEHDERAGGKLSDADKEKARKGFRPGAEFAIKRWFLLDALAKQEGITVSDEDYEEHLNRIAEAEGVEPDKVRESFRKNQAEGRVREDLLHRKVLDFLKENAKIKEEAIPETQAQAQAQG